MTTLARCTSLSSLPPPDSNSNPTGGISDSRETQIPIKKIPSLQLQKKEMESKKLAALLSTLVSELTLLLLALHPSSPAPLLSLDSNSQDFNSSFYGNIIHHILLSQEIAASFSLLTSSKKRKRTHLTEPDSDPTQEGRDNQLGSRLSELMRVVRNPDSFKTCFKMSSSTFEWLAGLLEPLLECRDPIGAPLHLSAELRLGIGLFRLATGSNYSDIAQRFGVTESATRFCTKQLCRVLCTNFRFWAAFPSPAELDSVSKDIEDLTGLPNCCGVITCARFKIVKKDNNFEDSIAVQIVVDSSSRILNVVAGFPGEYGDSRILKSTTLYNDIEGGKLLNSMSVSVDGLPLNQYLIGDGGYPLLPWLMVPFSNVVVAGPYEEKFNEASDLVRVSGVKTISSLRNWGVLSKPIEEGFKTAVGFIGACSILHNVLLMREDDSALFDVEDYSYCEQQRSQYSRDARMVESLVEGDASDIRRALAVRLAEFENF